MSHKSVAFGFFNIQTDMLLLQHLFFFADGFCAAVIDLLDKGEATLSGWSIEDRGKIGNLHGAIAGVDLSGFIGATYERFPFPSHEDGFKQNPDGQRTQVRIAEMIERFGRSQTIRLRWDRDVQRLSLGEFEFTQQEFSELLAYVDRGGYPRWKEEIRPAYVRVMTDQVSAACPDWRSDA